MIGPKDLVGAAVGVGGGEGEGGVAAVEGVCLTVEEGAAPHMGKTDSGVMVRRILGAALLLPYRVTNLGEEGEEEGVDFGWEEGEEFEVGVWEASRETSAMEGPRITRWMRLTLKSSNGVSRPNLLLFASSSLIMNFIPFFRRTTTKRAEHPRRSRSRIAFGTQREQHPSRAWRSWWPWRFYSETFKRFAAVETLV